MKKKAATSAGGGRSNPDVSLLRRADRVNTALGFDPREATVVQSLSGLGTTSLVGLNLTEDPAVNITKINASPYVRKALGAEEVHIHTIEAASSRFIADRFAFLSPKTLQNIAADASKGGFSIMTRHATPSFSGPGENPYGRTFAGAFDQQANLVRALVQFYMLRDYRPNGSAAPSTDDLNRGLLGGTLFDFSTTLTHGGADRLTCDVCKEEVFSSKCSHCPGTIYGMTDAEVQAQAARGIPDGKCTFTFDDWRAGEASIVYNGAIPGAGTAFSTRTASFTSQIEPPEPAENDDDEEEVPMFTAEFKISLGLSADATDDAVYAAIKNVQQLAATAPTLATENAALKAKAIADTDLAFTIKWTGKLNADVIAQIQTLPNREELATAFSGQLAAVMPATTTTQVVVPPIGDPLAGIGLAAAPVTTQPNEVSTVSEVIRKGLAFHDDAAKLKAAALTSPITALEKVLGTKLNATSELQMLDASTIQNRKATFAFAIQ